MKFGLDWVRIGFCMLATSTYVRTYKSGICYLEHSSMYWIPQADALPSELVE